MSDSQIKSPFMVFQEFLSPKQCTEILKIIAIGAPSKDKDGYTVKVERFNNEAENIIFSKFKRVIPSLETHYDLTYKGTEHLLFQNFPEGMKGMAENPHCENSEYIRKKWVKIRDRDITGILWLKDYNEKVPLDITSEVYGGKLEFPAYQFGLQPQRGTLVLYPSYPHFITATTPVLVGSSDVIRFHIAAKNNWLYDPSKFKGNYSEWFKEYT